MRATPLIGTVRAALAICALVATVTCTLAQSPEVPLRGRDRDPNLPPLDRMIPEKPAPGPVPSGSTPGDSNAPRPDPSVPSTPTQDGSPLPKGNG